nr:MAG TPA: hypothetical protein [Caudoviricetes sp.]
MGSRSAVYFCAHSPSCRLCEQIALRVVRRARLARGHATLPLTKKNSVRCPAALMQALEHVRHLCRVSLNCIPESQRARAPSCRRSGQAETVSRLIRECLGRKEV